MINILEISENLLSDLRKGSVIQGCKLWAEIECVEGFYFSCVEIRKENGFPVWSRKTPVFSIEDFEKELRELLKKSNSHKI